MPFVATRGYYGPDHEQLKVLTQTAAAAEGEATPRDARVVSAAIMSRHTPPDAPAVGAEKK